jgi:vanillate O-demethylase monooxygenase subunit
VVLWRPAEGAIVAQEDRCAHRMAPLSKGRIEGNSLRCMYHGLRFDQTGACIEIPGQDRIPPQFKVRTFTAFERSGIVWLWLGDRAPAAGEDPPDVAALFVPGWVGLRRYMHYRAGYELIRDNLLDLSHVAFVHEGTLAASSAAARRAPVTRRFPWGLTSAHSHPNEPLPPYLVSVAEFEGNVDRWFNSTAFVRSNVVLLEGGSAPVDTGALEGRRDSRALPNRALHVLTPETEASTHYFYSFRRGFAIDDPALTELLAERFDAAFEQDRDIIEAQSANIDPERPMLITKADSSLVYMRNLTRKLIREEQAEAHPRPTAHD